MARRILIVGGGYAGALLANRLARKSREAELVLLNARPWFVERVRLHQDARARDHEGRGLAEILDPRVRLQVGHVVDLDLQARRAEIENGPSEPFDELVLATGSVAARRAVPGAAHALSCATEEEALRLRDRMVGSRRVVVVGAGLTGIELATELAASHVSLVTSGPIGAALSTSARAYLQGTLGRLGVVGWEHVRVVAVERDGVILDSRRALPSDVTIWCAGFAPTALAAQAGLAVGQRRRTPAQHLASVRSGDRRRRAGDDARVRRAVANGLRHRVPARRVLRRRPGRRARGPRAAALHLRVRGPSLGSRSSCVAPPSPRLASPRATRYRLRLAGSAVRRPSPPGDAMNDDTATIFQAERGHLFGVAYRMLGSASIISSRRARGASPTSVRGCPSHSCLITPRGRRT